MAETNSNILTKLVEDLRAAHGDNLASVVLYGSTAAGDHAGPRSDHNILIALKRITTEELRRLYIPASTSVEKLSALMGDSIASFAALFRAVLILHGQEPPVTKPEVVRAIVRLLNLDGSPFEKIFELRSGGKFSLKLNEA